MNILVINCGSSSLKYQLINMDKEEVLAKGLVERIGIEGAQVKHSTTGKEEVIIEEAMEDHRKALELVLNALIDSNYGAISSMEEINAVGHRVVHGGEKFASSVIIDDEVMKALHDSIDLAPLHNPPNIMGGIEACKELMPDTPMVGGYLILHSIRLYQWKIIYIHFPMNYMRNMELENMVSMELLINMFLVGQLKF